MTQKLARLTQVMAGDTALTSPNVNWNAPTIQPATPASRDVAAPVLHEGIEALMIMEGLTAKWCINYWRVTNKRGAVTHVSGRNDWDEWQSAIKDLANTIVIRA